MKVVKVMPNGEDDEVSIVFFKPEKWEYDNSGYMIDDDLEEAYDRRGLKPVDPIALAAFNEADPAFADERPHGTHWRVGGRWCYAAFNYWIHARSVHVSGGINNCWLNTWWFAGVRK